MRSAARASAVAKTKSATPKMYRESDGFMAGLEERGESRIISGTRRLERARCDRASTSFATERFAGRRLSHQPRGAVVQELHSYAEQSPVADPIEDLFIELSLDHDAELHPDRYKRKQYERHRQIG